MNIVFVFFIFVINDKETRLSVYSHASCSVRLIDSNQIMDVATIISHIALWIPVLKPHDQKDLSAALQTYTTHPL